MYVAALPGDPKLHLRPHGKSERLSDSCTVRTRSATVLSVHYGVSVTVRSYHCLFSPKFFTVFDSFY